MPGGEALSVDLYKDDRWSGPVSPAGLYTDGGLCAKLWPGEKVSYLVS